MFAMRVAVVAAGFCCAAAARAQDASRSLAVGDEAPPISVETIHDASGRLPAAGPLPADFARGKVVVIEFSTSWCAGCVQAVPHINELARQFAGDESVVFLTVTNDSAEVADAFRRDAKIETPFARDEDGSLFEAYRVNGIPGTAIVGPDGRVAALLTPDHLMPEVIRKVKGGGRIEPSDWPAERIARNWDMRPMQEPPGDAPPIGVTVTKVAAAGGVMRTDPKTGVLRASGLPPAPLVASTLGVPVRLVQFVAPEPDGFYDMVAVPPDGKLETVRELARRALEEAWRLRVERTAIKESGYRLRRLAGTPALPPGEPRKGSVRRGAVDMPTATMSRLASVLGTFTEASIVDETGDPAEHAVKFEWNAAERGVEALAEPLRTLGLELVPGEVEVPAASVLPRE